MTLEKVFQKDEMEQGFPINKFIKKANPYKTLGELYSKAGLTDDEVKTFQKNPDSISIKNLNKILNLCEFDLKLTALFGEDIQELNLFGQMTTIFTAEESVWDEEDADWEEEMEEDEAYY
jgi:hypothetical protein